MFLYIDKEAIATLAMLKSHLFYPVTRLMSQSEAEEVDSSGRYKGTLFPFSFILAPSGKRNHKVLSKAKKGDKLIFISQNNQEYGYIIVDEIFPIDKNKRIKRIYGTTNKTHIGVKDTYKRLGDLAVCGDFVLNFEYIDERIHNVKQIIQETEAVKISSIMLSAKPFHRVHERLIRTALVRNDLVLLFLLKPSIEDFISFDVRLKTLEFFIQSYLPKNKVVLIPLENTYIFGGFNELILNAIVSKNFGATSLVIGKNHAGIGAFYDTHNHFISILDNIKEIIDIDVVSEFVYCNECKTLVSTDTCPHGRHHHIKYNSNSIVEMLKLGIIPPTILVRKEISSIILCSLFSKRKEKLRKIYGNIFPSDGLIDDFTNKDFYESLIELYQTSSLT
jgi:sulfate adenylyltransferase